MVMIKPTKITVLHTNDHHGIFGAMNMANMVWRRKNAGGWYPQRGCAEGGSVLLFPVATLTLACRSLTYRMPNPDFRGMNLVGYDAMAIGNHEFDNPLTVLRQQEKWAKFPLLSANIYQKSTGERLFKPWALFKRQDLKNCRYWADNR